MQIEIVDRIHSTLAGSTHPYMSGAFTPNDVEVNATDLEVIGEIPKRLDGVYLRNTQNPVHQPLGTYHPFDGDGMLHLLSFRRGRVEYRNRFVRTTHRIPRLHRASPTAGCEAMNFLADNVAPGLLVNLLLTAAVLVVCQLLLWLLSIRLRDASIVDIFWGPSFAVVALVTWLHQYGVGVESRKAVLLGLTSLWALRLGLHVYLRARGHGEDSRYAAFRKKATGNEHVFMLKHVFVKQGMAMWVTSIPVQVGMFWLRPESLGPLAWLGIAVWLVGFLFESIGDWQLVRFKADPANRGKIMQTGLWRYTRHPNYFGDACVWWGLFLIASDNWLGLLTVFAPLRMTHNLLNRTGKKLLEKKMSRERPEYAEYINRTSGFFPWPPRSH